MTVSNIGIVQSEPTGGPAYDAAALALFARMSPTPSTPRKTTINNLIVALKGYGIWTKIDVLYLFAADFQFNAQLNWKGASYNAGVVSSPSFTADRGFTGNATSSYLNSTFIAGSGGFALSDHAISTWVRTPTFGGPNNAAFGFLDGGGNGGIFMRGGAVLDGSGAQAATIPSGHNLLARASSASFEYYNAGSLVASYGGAGSFTNAGEIYILAQDTYDPFGLTYAPSNWSSAQLSAFSAGAGLTATEIGNFNTALTAYMTDVGAYP